MKPILALYVYPMSKLTHKDLVSFGQLLGYQLDQHGICAGFTGMLMQAILAKGEEQFWARLKLLEAYKTNYPGLLKEIDSARTKVKNLTQVDTQALDEHDIVRIELLAFYEGIELYQMPTNHRYLFNGRIITQRNLNDIYSLTYNNSLQQNSLKILLTKSYAFNQNSLTDYFNGLAEELSKYPVSSILISADHHITLLKYEPCDAEHPWMFADINDGARYPEHPDYYRKLATKELADNLFYSLSAEFKPNLFHLTFVVNNNKLIDYDPLSQWCNQYPITPDQATIYDKYGRGLLIESCEQGDINSIKILLTCPDLDINKASSDGATALYAAFFFEQIEVIRLLLKHPGIDVNKINPNGETVLHNACHQERVDLIELLLSCTDIDINKTSITGLTALDVACDMGEIRIIQRLLSHQAIDLCKLRDNTMALDRAFIQNNDKVILEFMKHIEKNKLSIHNYISPGTLEKVKNWLNDSVAAREFNSLLYVIQYVKNNLLVNAEAKSSVTKNNQCAMLHGLDNAPLASGGLFNSSAQKRSLGACEKGYSTKKSHHLDKENAQEYVQLGL